MAHRQRATAGALSTHAASARTSCPTVVLRTRGMTHPPGSRVPNDLTDARNAHPSTSAACRADIAAGPFLDTRDL